MGFLIALSADDPNRSELLRRIPGTDRPVAFGIWLVLYPLMSPLQPYPRKKAAADLQPSDSLDRCTPRF